MRSRDSMFGNMSARRLILKHMVNLMLLGAVINVAVAWLCVLAAMKTGVMVNSGGLTGSLDHLTKRELTHVHTGDWPLTSDRMAIWVLRGTSPGVQTRNALSVSDDYATPGYAGGYNYGLMRETRAGWPMPALLGYEVVRWENMIDQGERCVWAVPLMSRQRYPMSPTSIPLSPMWPGFVVNSAVFASGIWLLVLVPLAWRRRLRLKRGLCPACSYPVGQNDVCTECGAALPPPIR